MTYTIGMVQPRQFVEHGLGVSTYFDFGARLFSMQWPPYGAHILQVLISQFCWQFCDCIYVGTFVVVSSIGSLVVLSLLVFLLSFGSKIFVSLVLVLLLQFQLLFLWFLGVLLYLFKWFCCYISKGSFIVVYRFIVFLFYIFLVVLLLYICWVFCYFISDSSFVLVSLIDS